MFTPESVRVPLPLLVRPFAPDKFPLKIRFEVPVEPPLATDRARVPPRTRFAPIVWARGFVFAELVAVIPVFTVRFPAPARTEMFAVELLIVKVPAVTLLFTVVFPAAVKVALSPFVQKAPVVPLYQVLPPVQLPSPPAVEVPVVLQVKFAAFAFPPIAARARMDAMQRRFLNREPWGRDGEDTTKL